MTRRLSWPDKKKLEAVQAYILLGSIRQAATAVAVPEQTVKSWYGSQWWKDLEAELRTSSKLVLSSKLTGIVEKAMEQLNDRIAHGDFIYVRDKGFVRKSLNADVLNKIVNTAVDRSLALEKQATSKAIDEKSVEARLAKIKEELLAFVKKPSLAKKVNESEIINVNPDSQSQSLLSSLGRQDQGMDWSERNSSPSEDRPPEILSEAMDHGQTEEATGSGSSDGSGTESTAIESTISSPQTSFNY